MADIDITHSHAKSKEEAKAAVERVAQDLDAEFDIDYRWDGDALRFERSGANGRLDVGVDSVRVVINLSFPLSLMNGQIKKEAQTLLNEHLA